MLVNVKCTCCPTFRWLQRLLACKRLVAEGFGQFRHTRHAASPPAASRARCLYIRTHCRPRPAPSSQSARHYIEQQRHRLPSHHSFPLPHHTETLVTTQCANVSRHIRESFHTLAPYQSVRAYDSPRSLKYLHYISIYIRSILHLHHHCLRFDTQLNYPFSGQLRLSSSLPTTTQHIA